MKHFVGKGEIRAWKLITIRVFHVGNEGKTTTKFHAGPGKAYTEDNIEALLEKIAEDLDQRLPQEEYSIIQVGPQSFNFVWQGKRAPRASVLQAEE